LLAVCSRLHRDVLKNVPFSTVLSKEIAEAYEKGTLTELVMNPACQQVGLDCVGLAWLLHCLLEEHGIMESYMVPSFPVPPAKSGTGEFHVALLLEFQSKHDDGFLLFDLGLHFPVPLLFQKTHFSPLFFTAYASTEMGNLIGQHVPLNARTIGLQVTHRHNGNAELSAMPSGEIFPDDQFAGKSDTTYKYMMRPANSFNDLNEVNKSLCRQQQSSLEFAMYHEDGKKVSTLKAVPGASVKVFTAGSRELREAQKVDWKKSPKLPEDFCQKLKNTSPLHNLEIVAFLEARISSLYM